MPKTDTPHMVMADEGGNIFEHPHLRMLGASGRDFLVTQYQSMLLAMTSCVALRTVLALPFLFPPPYTLFKTPQF